MHAKGILREVAKVVDEDDCRGVAASITDTQQGDSVARHNVVRVVRKLLEGSPTLAVKSKRSGLVLLE